MKPSLTIPVTEMSQVGEARRLVAGYAQDLGRSEVQNAEVAIVVSEFATNLVKHGGGGQLLVSSYDGYLDILSIDSGAGIGNLAVSMEDGFSTSGTSGNGLGAIRRMADTFDVFSMPGKGTVILARFGTAKQKFEFGAICVPVAGETKCGDSFGVKYQDEQVTVLVIDGLGHGPLASDAANAGVDAFQKATSSDHASLLQTIHGALRASRGAAASLLTVDSSRQIATFTGVGNVSGIVCSDQVTRRMISHSGIVGQNMRKIQDFTYPAHDSDAVFVMYSDGIATHWELSQYPGLSFRHPSVIAGVIFRDHCRGRDDATLAVFKRGANR